MIRFTLNKRNKAILIIFSILIALDLIFALLTKLTNPKKIIEEKKDYGYIIPQNPLPTEPEPTQEDKTKPQINITETNNEYIIHNIESVFYDKSGNIFFRQLSNTHDDNIYKYYLNTKEIQQVTVPETSYAIIRNDYIIGISKQDPNPNDEFYPAQFCGMNKAGGEGKNTGFYYDIYKIDNGNLVFFEKVDCRYSVYLGYIEYLFTSKTGKKILQSKGQGNSEIYRKEDNNKFQIIQDTAVMFASDKLRDKDIDYIGFSSNINSIILTEWENIKDKYDEYGQNLTKIKRIFIKDVDTLSEKTIINFNQNIIVDDLKLLKISNTNYLSYILNKNQIIILNLDNNEKIFDEIIDTGKCEFENSSNVTCLLSFDYQNNDKLLYSTEKTQKCLNLAAKQWVNVDACGDPKKTFLGEFNGKKIYIEKIELAN